MMVMGLEKEKKKKHHGPSSSSTHYPGPPREVFLPPYQPGPFPFLVLSHAFASQNPRAWYSGNKPTPLVCSRRWSNIQISFPFVETPSPCPSRLSSFVLLPPQAPVENTATPVANMKALCPWELLFPGPQIGPGDG
jgi:hypothetical protein